MLRFFISAICSAIILIGFADAQETNPRILKAVDSKLEKEFEYLVFDLGKGVDLKLVKIQAKGKTFTIGTTKDEQDLVIRDYFEGKKSSVLDHEVAAMVTLTDDYYVGQFEVYRAQLCRAELWSQLLPN